MCTLSRYFDGEFEKLSTDNTNLTRDNACPAAFLPGAPCAMQAAGEGQDPVFAHSVHPDCLYRLRAA